MVLKNLVQGLNIQKLLFNELDDLINDGTILDCVNECFAQLDKELEEEYSNVTLFQFSTQLAELFYKGVYGMDYVITQYCEDKEAIEIFFFETLEFQNSFYLLFPINYKKRSFILSDAIKDEYKSVVKPFIDDGFFNFTETTK